MVQRTRKYSQHLPQGGTTRLFENYVFVHEYVSGVTEAMNFGVFLYPFTSFEISFPTSFSCEIFN